MQFLVRPEKREFYEGIIADASKELDLSGLEVLEETTRFRVRCNFWSRQLGYREWAKNRPTPSGVAFSQPEYQRVVLLNRRKNGDTPEILYHELAHIAFANSWAPAKRVPPRFQPALGLLKEFHAELYALGKVPDETLASHLLGYLDNLVFPLFKPLRSTSRPQMLDQRYYYDRGAIFAFFLAAEMECHRRKIEIIDHTTPEWVSCLLPVLSDWTTSPNHETLLEFHRVLVEGPVGQVVFRRGKRDTKAG